MSQQTMAKCNGTYIVRPSTPSDMGEVLQMIKGLCVYEKEPESTVVVSEQDLIKDGFGDVQFFSCLVAEWKDSENDHSVLVGFALYFKSYSTWKGRTVYLEDLFVCPEYRGKGIGTALLKKLSEICMELNCARMAWSCLDWNKPTLDFYRSIGAQCLPEWKLHHFSRPEMDSFVRERPVDDKTVK